MNLVSELLQAVPRLVDRTKSQAELASSLLGHLPCLAAVLGAGREDDRDRVVPGMGETVGIDVLSLLDEEPQLTSAVSSNGAAAPAPADPSPEPTAALTEGDLPIQDYDSLAASQVVPRLATMTADELRAVRSYELANRNRQTILNRINQRLTG